jgi:ABC-type Fe3+-siderophore transport system permease subunit
VPPASTLSNAPRTRLIVSERLLPVGLAAAFLLLVVVALAVGLGAAQIELPTVGRALFAYDETAIEQVIIRTVRLSRVVAGVLIGAALAGHGANGTGPNDQEIKAKA